MQTKDGLNQPTHSFCCNQQSDQCKCHKRLAQLHIVCTTPSKPSNGLEGVYIIKGVVRMFKDAGKELNPERACGRRAHPSKPIL